MKDSKIAMDTLVALGTVVLTAVVVAAMYFGRALLVPIAFALLVTFLLSPVAARLERRVGRAAAVCGLAVVIFAGLGAAGWIITRQALDLMAKLPDYRANIEKKIQAVEISKESPIKRFSQMVVDVESELPGLWAQSRSSAQNPRARARPPVEAAPVAAAPVAQEPLDQMRGLVTPFLDLVGTTGVVMILVIFMLLKREDLRARFIKIVGHGRISTTTRAMEDAGERVSRYLVAQLIVNLVFGTAIALGLFAIGVPNAFLWGALAALLRFVPYVGAATAAVGPVALALAVSPGWQMLVLTVALFLVLELVTGNLLEPLLFRSSTGISSLALIVAAIFWAWLWGPIGLILSTPLTVCLAVIGRHVRQLSFLSVLLGNEDPLTPSEECYHRLLVGGMNEASLAVDSHVKSVSLTALYDDVLIPTITMAEADFLRDELQDEQRTRVLQGVKDIVDDLESRPRSGAPLLAAPRDAEPAAAGAPRMDCRVVCIPPRSERDAIASSMLLHLLRELEFEGAAADLGLPIQSLSAFVSDQKADAVCISVMPPSNIMHTRQLCSKLRQRFPKLKIIVGMWGATEKLDEPIEVLRAGGADEVVVSLADAVAQLVSFASSIVGDFVPAPIPADEDERLSALRGLKAFAAGSNPAFNAMTKKLTRAFEVPIALITLIDRDHQHFKSQFGLPPEYAGICEIPRDAAICSYVVAANAVFVVEDLARDRRFANNPFLKAHHLRFYAGAPLRSINGQPVGALCILDTKPRVFGETEMRMLRVMGEEISDQLAAQVIANLNPQEMHVA